MKTLYNIKGISTHLFITMALVILLQSGCKKQIDIDLPIDKSTAETVYSNTGTAVSAMNGIYILLSKGSFAGGPDGVSVSAGLLADELVDNNALTSLLYTNSFVQDPTSLWRNMYGEDMIRINSFIEGVSASTGIPDRSKKILLGQAKVLRALIYFNLVNLYGDVPLVTTTDFKINSNIPRSPKSLAYDLIIKDLTEAQQALTDQYLGLDLNSVTQERVTPNRAAATALLARVYLYLEQWAKAEEEASKIISNNTMYGLSALNGVFLANSSEAIWQLQSISNVNDGFTITADARYLIPKAKAKPVASVSLNVMTAFQTNDGRKNAWVRVVRNGTTDYPIPNKYKAGIDRFASNPEYTMVFRLGEQYLIRAEARAQQNKLTGANSAESDLNAIRTRAGLSGTTATTQTAMLDAILAERQLELFSEGGHRWFDLKRTGKIDAVMSVVAPAKGGTWAPYKALLPIPNGEFQLNPALKGHQNPGYLEYYN